MDAVTAVKIQIVKANPLNAANPLAAIASDMKNAMRKGPALASFPIKISESVMTRKNTAIPNAILQTLIFFMKWRIVSTAINSN